MHLAQFTAHHFYCIRYAVIIILCTSYYFVHRYFYNTQCRTLQGWTKRHRNRYLPELSLQKKLWQLFSSLCNVLNQGLGEIYWIIYQILYFCIFSHHRTQSLIDFFSFRNVLPIYISFLYKIFCEAFVKKNKKWKENYRKCIYSLMHFLVFSEKYSVD